MSDNKEKATINLVAQRAGVSVATVSRVFNHKGIVSGDTLSRVLESAAELNYKSDAVRALSRGDTCPHDNDLLILNLPSLDNPFYSEIIKGAKSSAKLHHCDVLINQGHLRENNIDEYLQMLKRVSAKGVIVMNHVTEPVLNRLVAALPIVQCGEYIEGANAPSVSVDDLAAAKRVMEYILSTGRRKVAFVNGPAEYKYACQRRQGYYEALESAGLPINPSWIIQLSDISADMAFSSVAKLLSQPNPPDAFFTVSDVIAAAVIRAARYNHYRVPEDIIVVGFDNVDISSATIPSITTVNQPKFQLGFIAAEMLCEKLSNPDSETQHMLLDTELIIRESTSLPVAQTV